MTELIKIIEAQQAGHVNDDVFMVGEYPYTCTILRDLTFNLKRHFDAELRFV